MSLKLGENVAVIILGVAKWQKPGMFTKCLKKCAFWQKNDIFWRQNPLEPNHYQIDGELGEKVVPMKVSNTCKLQVQ